MYLDDILITGATFDEHVQPLENVLHARSQRKILSIYVIISACLRDLDF